MTESMLQILMRLFAILASISKDVSFGLSRNFVESYLKTQFHQKIIDQSLIFFDSEMKKLSVLDGVKENKRTSSLSVKILSICSEINKELPVRSKYLMLFSLIQFSKYFENKENPIYGFSQTISDTVKTISEHLLIDKEEFLNCLVFITEKFYKLPHKNKLLVLSNDKMFIFSEINHLQKDNFDGQFFFLKITQADLLIFYYLGKARIDLNGRLIFPGHVYIFPKGSALRNENMTPIYYSDIESGYLRRTNFEKITFIAHDIEFRFPGSQNGIHPFSFLAESGSFIGIMGGSGAGKSTLIKALNGIYSLKNGTIYLNGHNLQTENKKLKGLLGYVPQDDLLIEELTVYQNLFYNAKLCLGGMNTNQINETVHKILNNLDLFHIKDLLVGSPLNKYISGGQRKRLNIALELIKEPYVLFADEPTTGLSSTDSENVMQLLKDLTLQGKIVIITIHQPSSELFKMFDKLLVIDRGGFPVYFGNPLSSISYLKKIANRIDAAEIECPYCGHVQPAEILKVVEARQVNEFGEFIPERIINPDEWYGLYLKNIQNNQIITKTFTDIPATKFKVPEKLNQFITYLKRNFYSKIADKQFVLFSLLISPLLAIILSLFTKYFSGNIFNAKEYLFINNLNLPAYIFMSVIVSLFIGLIISAEEIIKDRKILDREKFLNLSRTAYINSKVLYLFLLSAFQMLVFVLLANKILGIQGMAFSYWIVLFSTSCFAIMLGLNISSAFKSVISIYINIPFILIPLILLSGIIVKYDKLHYRLTSTEYVPVIGDIMASRWAYEALIVNQFKNNKYQKYFYQTDQESANSFYELNFLIPEISNRVKDYEFLVMNKSTRKAKETLTLITNSINGSESSLFGNIPDFNNYNIPEKFNIRTKEYLKGWRTNLILKTKSLASQKDDIIENILKGGLTRDDIIKIKENYYNKSVADLVLNTNEMIKIVEKNGKLVRKDSPVYQYPTSKYGRSQFYSGIKRIGILEFDTLWFNVLVIWLMAIFLYLTLVTDIFKNLIKLTSKR